MDMILQALSGGLLQWSWERCIVITLILTHITIAAVTIFLHRHQTHRALDLHPIASHFFRFWLWITTGMKTKTWKAVHYKHHQKCETIDDPHSPQVLGIRKVLFEGAELYRKAETEEMLDQYGHGTPDDWLERNLYTRYSGLGIRLMLIIDLALFGVIGATVWAVQMMWIPFLAAGVINGIGHYRWGYRNFDRRYGKHSDYSINIVPLGILIGGEELHNNHHEYPRSAKFSYKKMEFDIGWMYIRILETLHLARVKNILGEKMIV